MINSPDLYDMANSIPEDPYDFSILVEALIGLEGEQGAEMFSFIVTTIKALSDKLCKSKFLSGRGYIILQAYDYSAIEEAINSYCKESSCVETWDDFAKKMCKYGYWEYENVMS